MAHLILFGICLSKYKTVLLDYFIHELYISCHFVLFCLAKNSRNSLSLVSACVINVSCDCPMTSALVDSLDDDRFSGSSTANEFGGFDYSFSASRMSTYGSENVWMAATEDPGEYIQVLVYMKITHGDCFNWYVVKCRILNRIRSYV